MADFDNLAPPARITNPAPDGKSAAVVDKEYPRHMHAKDGSWIVIANAKEQEAARKKGYALLPFDNSRADDAAGDDAK